MKLVVLAAAAFVGVSAPASAQYYIPRPMVPIGPLPPASVSEMVRQMGLEPVGAPVRSGPVYFQRAADYYGKPLRVVIDAQRAQVVSVEPVDGPPMMHGGPYASAGAPYWRRPSPYPYGMPDDDAIAPPGSVMAPHGQPPQAGLPPAPSITPHAQPQPGLPPVAQPKPAKSAAITPAKPPVPRKRPAEAPQQTAGSVEPLPAAPAPSPVRAEKPTAAAPPAASQNPANAMPPVTPLE
jgi:hypothetical protein